MSLIDIKNLSLEYPGQQNSDETILALDRIDLSIQEGEFVVFLGASGCGKSTLLNIIAGFLFPTSGFAEIQGERIKKPHPERGMVFQKNALMPWLNVKDNVELSLKFLGVKEKDRSKTSEKVLDWVGLSDFQENYVYQLSGGMQQRVGIARALVSDPDILLMDEPLGALDAITREEVQEAILRVWEKSGKTVAMVTHSIEEALFMATRLVIMTPRPGRIVETHNLSFSKKFIEGMPGKDIKQLDEFIALKQKVLRVVESESNTDS